MATVEASSMAKRERARSRDRERRGEVARERTKERQRQWLRMTRVAAKRHRCNGTTSKNHHSVFLIHERKKTRVSTKIKKPTATHSEEKYKHIETHISTTGSQTINNPKASANQNIISTQNMGTRAST